MTEIIMESVDNIKWPRLLCRLGFITLAPL